MARNCSEYQNIEWGLPTNLQGDLTWDAVKIAILADIRRELHTLNRVFQCPRFLDIPNKLDKIERNTKKRKRRAKK